VSSIIKTNINIILQKGLFYKKKKKKKKKKKGVVVDYNQLAKERAQTTLNGYGIVQPPPNLASGPRGS
jgi:hypothetical protein